MFELHQLEQLLAVAQCGTLSAAAESLHLSQPALSRSMRRLEEELSVPLFSHAKNKISFNENGELALKYADQIVRQAQEMKRVLIAFERTRRTLSVGSCAPGPLWSFLPKLSALHPDMTITSEIRDLASVQEKFFDETYRIAILPHPLDMPGVSCQKIEEEHLYFTLPPAHPLADRKSLTLADLDGESMLLRPNLGFWETIVKQGMPRTNFIVQDAAAFDELVKFSVLPSFVTNLSLGKSGAPEGRCVIPIEDDAVRITYYICYRKDDLKKLAKLTI